MSELVHVSRKAPLYLFFVVLTIALIIWQHLGMNTQILVTKNTFQAFSDTDQINGGASVADMAVSENRIAYSCQVKHNPNSFPYCGIVILFGQEKGLDLQGYDSLSFDIDYHSNHRDTLLVYLTNKEGDDGQPIERQTMRTLFPIQGKQHIQLNLDHFSVPSWWIFYNHQPNEHGIPARFNINKLRFTTGDSPEEREVHFILSNVTISGKWIRADSLYFSLLIFWISLIFADASRTILKTQRAYLDKKQESSSLKELNQFLAIERDKFETMAKFDPLTGCYNRAGFRDIISHQLKHNRNHKHSFSLIVIDIDRFKEVNDRFGHDVGDTVIKRIAKLLRSSVREQDFVARWGGEEFLVLCPITPIKGGITLAENLRRSIADSDLFDQGAITCSFGVSQLKGQDFQTAFHEADLALYQAKKSGRNCVRVKE